MATYDHYVNGEWVGSTEVPGHSNQTGWVNTYSKDGNSYATWVSNSDHFDYRPNQNQTSEPLVGAGNEEMAKELIHKWSFRIFYSGVILGFIAMIVGFIVFVVSSISSVGIEKTFERILAIFNSIITVKELLPLLFSCLVWVGIFIVFKIVKFSRKRRK